MRAPILGQTVHYRTRQGRQTVRAAMITGTSYSLHPDAVAAGDVPAVSSDHHVHLWVFTPGADGWPENDVPAHAEQDGATELAPGTWRRIRQLS